MMGMGHPTRIDRKSRQFATDAPQRRKRRTKGRQVRRRRAQAREARQARRRASKARRARDHRSRATKIGLNGTRRMMMSIFKDVHAKRVQSLANYAAGAMQATSTAIHAIGTAYAELADIKPKHGIKQADRYLSNTGIDIVALTPAWAKFVIGARTEILLAMDWTEFEPDDHTTLCVYLVTIHGRATPLAWQTYKKSTLNKGARTEAEHAMVERLARAIPPDISITLLADRGFGARQFYETLELLGWNFVIRFRASIVVEHGGEAKPASQWLPPSGRAKKLTNAKVTLHKYEVGAVIAVKRKGMKDAWYLATNLKAKAASVIIQLYGRRFTIEETFRDQKDLRFGMGLSATHIRKPERRDRLLMLLAIAQALLTLLGAASERSGLDAYLKANTVKRRTHSLFRQGSHWYRCLLTMRDDWFERLMTSFDEILAEHSHMSQILGVI